jgi:hypothetical protein
MTQCKFRPKTSKLSREFKETTAKFGQKMQITFAFDTQPYPLTNINK